MAGVESTSSQKRAPHPVGTAGAPPRLATRSASASGPSTPVPANWVSQRPADPSRSLYNVCATILARMERVPSLVPYIAACDYTSNDAPMPQINLGVAPFGSHIDPVSQLWRILRLGAPLCVLFNALDTNTKLETLPPGQCAETRVVKKLLYRFLEACMTELGFRPEKELFTISNVFSDSTSDFLKVLKTVQAILDLIEAKHPVPASSQTSTEALKVLLDLPAASSKRDNVVLELVNTERKYVQDLELLAQYHDALLAASIPRETVQKMFPYLSRLVDFQRRFLVGLEYHARLPPTQQQFGSLFALMKDEFQVYEGYTLNQKEASDLALVEVPQLLPFSDILEPNYELQAMLIKPVQRICKYPLLLKEIIKNTPSEWAPYGALLGGLEIMQDITQTVNETQRRIENRFVFDDLRERLKDWRGLALERMGDLLLSGNYPVVTGDHETEYHLYLFETILLCCKDSIPPKKSGPLKMRSRQSKRFSLDLKGRIYMSYVTSTKVTKDYSGYLVSVLWGRGEAGETGSFDIRVGNEEQANLWELTIQKLIHARINQGTVTGYEEDEGAAAQPFYDEPATPTSVTSPVDPRGLHKLSTSSFGNASLASSFDLSTTPTASRLSQSEIARRSSSGVNGASWNALNGAGAFSAVNGANGGTTSVVSPPQLVHANSESMLGTLQNLPASTRSSYSTTTLNGNVSHSSNASGISNGLRSLSINSTFNDPSQSASSHKFTGLPPLQTTGSTVEFNLGSFSAQPAAHNASATSAGSQESAGNASHRVRVHHRVDSFLLLVPKDITYDQLQARVERKIRLCGKLAPDPLRMKYRDEDDDFVTLGTDEDLQMALEERSDSELLLWIS